MKHIKTITYILCLVLMSQACSNPSDGTPENGSGNGGNQDAPNGVSLVFPVADALCNEGTNLTPTESTVFFEWQPNTNAESYTLTIENLDSGTITQHDTEEFIFPVTIQRAVAFRWFVEYVHQNEIKQSAIWNFYNAGPGVQSYAPFPADIISPSMAQNISATNLVTLEWIGSDVDNDIVSYDVYFGTEISPSLNASAVPGNQLAVSVVSNNIYYWNVVTTDAAGNTSESGVHQFKVLE